MRTGLTKQEKTTDIWFDEKDPLIHRAKLQQSYPMLLVMALVVVCMLALYGVAIARTANREISKLNWKPNS